MKSRRPEQAKRDCLVISIGGVAAQAAAAGVLMRNLGISQDALHCQILWLGIDTDELPPWKPGPDESQVVVRHVRTADRRGRSQARDYRERCLRPWLVRSIEDPLLPTWLKPSHLEQSRLIRDLDTSEASKNPHKGFVFMVANLPNVRQTLKDMKRMMVARDRTILIVASPSSGTASGGWLLTLGLLMDMFPNTPPIVVWVMPSRLEGRYEHVERNHAIFGWHSILLEHVVRHGLVADWEVPVLGGAPIYIHVDGSQPAATYLISARRRTGGEPLDSTDEVTHVLGQVLTLMIVGKGEGRGLPSAYSHVRNHATDALRDEEEADAVLDAREPEEVRVGTGSANTNGHTDRGAAASRLPYLRPTKISLQPPRRFAAIGLFTITYNAKIFDDFTRLGTRRAIVCVLLGDAATPTDTHVVQNWREEIQAWPSRMIASFLDYQWSEIPKRAWTPRRESRAKLLEAIEDEVKDYGTGLQELVGGWETDGRLHLGLGELIGTTEPRSLRQLQEVLQKLHLGLGKRQVLNVYAKLDQLNASSRKNLADEKPDDELQEIVASFRKRANGANTALRRLRPLPAGATERQQTDHAQHREQLVGIILESSFKAKALEVAATLLLELLKRVLRECADRLNSVVRGIEAVSAADAREVARYEQRLKDRSYLQRYNYELAYPLANERIESLDRQTETWARNFVRSLRFSPDEAPPDREAVRRSLDAAASEGTADSHIDVGAVLGMLVENNHLLHLALNRGRALVEIQGERYETTWSISHSGEDSEKNQLACRELEAAIRAALPGEQFARVTVNAGRLPLREKADVLVVLQEQVIDFQLRQTVSDLEFEAYLEADEEVSNRGGLPIHRLHDRLLRATSATALDWEAP